MGLGFWRGQFGAVRVSGLLEEGCHWDGFGGLQGFWEWLSRGNLDEEGLAGLED